MFKNLYITRRSNVANISRCQIDEIAKIEGIRRQFSSIYARVYKDKMLTISPNLTEKEIEEIRKEESPALLQVTETTTPGQRDAISQAQITHKELRKLEETLRQVGDLFQTVQTLLYAQVRQMCSIHLMQFIP